MKGRLKETEKVKKNQTSPRLPNRFNLSEWSGAVGDLGTLLPLAFALVVYNGFLPAKLFLLWGIVYLVTGWFYRVPVSVQPLKAMAVIAIAKGFSTEFLSTAAVFYGLLLLILAGTGIIRWLHNWFSPALVRGIQLGIGLILAQKAIELVLDKGFLLNHSAISSPLNIVLLLLVATALWFFQFRKKFPLTLLLIVGSVVIIKFSGISWENHQQPQGIFTLLPPRWDYFLDAFIFLILPQLPLTLGNAVFAANDSCHLLWGQRSRRVNPTRLSLSIGLSDLFIGLLGGFPICHGAGGIGAHAQFGAKTGGATIILGGILILSAFISPLSSFLFLIPVPLLAAMLLFDSWRMMTLVQRLDEKMEMLVAILVGVLSFAIRNLSVALAAGFLLEQGWLFYQKRMLTKIEGSEE